MRCASGIEPTALEASVKATIRVRGPSSASSASTSRVTSEVRSGAVRTTSPWSSATRSHGATFASWSSSVTTISSPGCSVRATACASAKFSVVMFGPSAISAGSDAVSSAAASRARPMSAFAATDVANAPPSLAVPARSWSRMASATAAGTWDRPGRRGTRRCWRRARGSGRGRRGRRAPGEPTRASARTAASPSRSGARSCRVPRPRTASASPRASARRCRTGTAA